MDINFTKAEWEVMECIWNSNGITSADLVRELSDKMSWSRSTILTLLKRLEEKKAVYSSRDGSKNIYIANVDREKVAMHETKNFLNRVYNGSIGLMINSFTRKEELSKAEIDELYEILKRRVQEND